MLTYFLIAPIFSLRKKKEDEDTEKHKKKKKRECQGEGGGARRRKRMNTIVLSLLTIGFDSWVHKTGAPSQRPGLWQTFLFSLESHSYVGLTQGSRNDL